MGERVINLAGYVEIKVGPGSKYKLEHRIVVENFIGRKLKKNEIIHHINLNKTDNRIDNLMIFKSNMEHSKFHAKIRQFGYTNPVKRQIKERWEEHIKESA